MPTPSALGRQRASSLVPDVLGVDEDPIEVEDDCVDHIET